MFTAKRKSILQSKIKRFNTFAFIPPVRYNVSDGRDFLHYRKLLGYTDTKKSLLRVEGITSFLDGGKKGKAIGLNKSESQRLLALADCPFRTDIKPPGLPV